MREKPGEQYLIERLDKTRMNERCIKPLRPCALQDAAGKIQTSSPRRNQYYVRRSTMQNLKFPKLDGIFGLFFSFAALSRIADHKRTVPLRAHTEHGTKFRDVFRNGDGKIGDRQQKGEIKDALVGLAVSPRHPRPIDTEDDGQILRADIVDDFIVGTL